MPVRWSDSSISQVSGLTRAFDEGDVAIVDLGLLVKKLEDAAGAGKSHDDGVDLLGNLADLTAELLGHVEEGDHDGNGERHAGEGEVGHPKARKTPPASATMT